MIDTRLRTICGRDELLSQLTLGQSLFFFFFFSLHLFLKLSVQLLILAPGMSSCQLIIHLPLRPLLQFWTLVAFVVSTNPTPGSPPPLAPYSLLL